MSRQSDGEQSVFYLRASPFGVIAAAAFLLAAVGWLDFVTGKDTSFTILYLVPVSTAAWFAGRRIGLAFCVLAAACELVVEFASDQPNPVTACWNAGVKFGVYFAFCSLLEYVRTHRAGGNVLRSLYRRFAVGIGLAVSLAVIVAVSQWLIGGNRLNRRTHLQAGLRSPEHRKLHLYVDRFAQFLGRHYARLDQQSRAAIGRFGDIAYQLHASQPAGAVG